MELIGTISLALVVVGWLFQLWLGYQSHKRQILEKFYDRIRELAKDHIPQFCNKPSQESFLILSTQIDLEIFTVRRLFRAKTKWILVAKLRDLIDFIYIAKEELQKEELLLEINSRIRNIFAAAR